MGDDHGYPAITAEVRALYNKKDPTDADLLAMAIIEADHALRSLPPHCLPTAGGLPHSEDHANCSAHRCWSFLTELARRRTIATNVCEHGDHAALDGKRFCGPECEECEHAEFDAQAHDCAGICLRDGPGTARFGGTKEL